MTDETLESLSADDQAYFSSRGETVPEPKPQQTVEEVDPDVEADLVEDVGDDEAAKAAIEGQPKKLVPLAALTKERQAAKEIKGKLAEIEQRHAILEDRWNTLLAMQQQVEQPQPVDEDPMPDKNVDLFAFAEWQQRQIDKLKAKVDGRDEQEAQARQEQDKEKAVWNYWHQSAQAYKAENPDFDEAVKWMSETRTKQLSTLKKLHPQFATEAGIVQQINQELKEIVVAAANARVSPAEYIYEMAQQWGYTPKAAPTGEQTTEEAIAALTKTQETIEGATSLSQGGGQRPSVALDAKAIANMSPTEFEAWYAKNPDKFRKMAGG